MIENWSKKIIKESNKAISVEDMGKMTKYHQKFYQYQIILTLNFICKIKFKNHLFPGLLKLLQAMEEVGNFPNTFNVKTLMTKI